MTPVGDIDTAIGRVIAATTTDFVELVKIAGLDPSQDFRYANLSGVNFSGADLRGFDFTGALLEGASFVGARIAHANFGHSRALHQLLKEASDFREYIKSIRGSGARKRSPPIGDHSEREKILAPILDSALAGKNVLIVGRRGSGKTHLLNLIKEGLKDRGIGSAFVRGGQVDTFTESLFDDPHIRERLKKDGLVNMLTKNQMQRSAFESSDGMLDLARMTLISVLHSMASPPRTALLLDEVAALPVYPSMFGRDQPKLLELLSRTEVQFIATTADLRTDLGNVTPWADFISYELPDLSVEEVDRLLHTWLESRSQGSAHLGKHVARLLAGFNFRELYHLFSEVGAPSGKNELWTAVAKGIARLMSSHYQLSLEDADSKMISQVEHVLNAAARSEGVDSSEIDVVLRNNADRQSRMLRTFTLLLANGAVVRGPDRRLNFANALAREWWLNREQPEQVLVRRIAKHLIEAPKRRS